MKHFLITTALEQSWRDNEPVLFLGEWCKLHSRKDIWSEMDVEVLPYHWNDRAKLYTDYQYLQDFYERLLQDLTPQLNLIHGTNHNPRYWRILLGPWLGYFIQILFDRWTSIQQAIAHYDLSGTILLTGHEETLVPSDMTDFIRLIIGDEWNHHIYARILQGFTSVPCIKEVRHVNEGLAKVQPKSVGWKQRVSRTLARFYRWGVSSLTQDQDAFFLNIDLPIFDEMRLYRRLGQVPTRWRVIPPVQIAVDEEQRQWVVAGESRTEFEACTRTLIPLQLPSVYLEGYSQLVKQTESLPWPKQPKLIWSNNSFNSDEVFKAWAAEKAERGSAVVTGQHGGHFGVGRWSFIEDHEIAISDCYLSWGWLKTGETKVKPVGQFKKKLPLGVQHMEQRGALLVTCIVPRQSYWMFSVVVASQWLEYFNDQCVFVENLPRPIRDTLTVRLHTKDYGWGQVSRWRDRFPSLRLDEAQSDIKNLIRQSRLYISTYNATTFLESFTMNVPTVIYWNPTYWELRDSAVPYFEDLKRVGIFHETPESAAHHVADIWDDVDTWWNSLAVREVLERFTQCYSYLPEDLLDQVESTLCEVIENNNQPVNAGETL